MSKHRVYPSDLTQSEWEFIRTYMPPAKPGGRPRTADLREVVNALRYLMRTGCQWRYIPDGFPKWRTVYGYFRLFLDLDLFSKINFALCQMVRQKLGRSKLPHLGIIDAQAVRAPIGENRGYEGFKKVRGRKRSIIVDSLGLMWSCHVHSANDQDAGGGAEALDKLYEPAKGSIEVMLADLGYDRNPFKLVALYVYDLKLRFSKSATKGHSTIKHKRWIVERTFAWFNNFRRLSKDYERQTKSSEALDYFAMSTMCMNRLWR